MPAMDVDRLPAAAIGIDLGFSTCCVAVCGGKDAADIIPCDDTRFGDSLVAFSVDGGERWIGKQARMVVEQNPERCVYGMKRIIGRAFRNEVVQADARAYPFSIVEGRRGEPLVVIDSEKGQQKYSVEHITAMLLGQLKANAEKYLGRPVVDAVIAVPAGFNQSQRHAMIDAAAIAGLNVLRLVNETTAAALASAHLTAKETKSDGFKKVLILALGGGMCEASVLTVAGDTHRVEAVQSDTSLGGEDFTVRLMQLLSRMIPGVECNPVMLGRLRSAAETAKRALFLRETAFVPPYSLTETEGRKLTVKRTDFEAATSDLLQRCEGLVRRVLVAASCSRESIHEVVLVGGGTRIPKLIHVFHEAFGKNKLLSGVEVEEIVANGAAFLAWSLSRRRHSGMAVDGPNVVGIASRCVHAMWGASAGGMQVIQSNDMLPAQAGARLVLPSQTWDQCPHGILIENLDDKCKLTLTGLNPAIEKTVELVVKMDEDGLLSAEGRGSFTGRTVPVSIVTRVARLTGEEVTALVKDREEYCSWEEERTRRREASNHLQAFADQLSSSSIPPRLSCKVKNAEKEIELVMSWLRETVESDPLPIQEYERRLKRLKFTYAKRKFMMIVSSEQEECCKKCKRKQPIRDLADELNVLATAKQLSQQRVEVCDIILATPASGVGEPQSMQSRRKGFWNPAIIVRPGDSVDYEQLKRKGLVQYLIPARCLEEEYLFALDDDVNVSKVALTNGLKTFVPVTETSFQLTDILTDKKSGADPVVQQLEKLSGEIDGKWSDVVVVYRPRSQAIQKGIPNTEAIDSIQQSHERIRDWIAGHVDDETAAGTHIIYGGFVNRRCWALLAEKPDVDGFLVDVEEATPSDFLSIVRDAFSLPTVGKNFCETS